MSALIYDQLSASIAELRKLLERTRTGLSSVTVSLLLADQISRLEGTVRHLAPGPARLQDVALSPDETLMTERAAAELRALGNEMVPVLAPVQAWMEALSAIQLAISHPAWEGSDLAVRVRAFAGSIEGMVQSGDTPGLAAIAAAGWRRYQ